MNKRGVLHRVGFLRDLFTKYHDMLVIILAYGIFAIGGALFWAAIPILSESALGLGTFAIGLIMASIGFVYIFTDEPTGVLLDFVGYKTGFIIGILFAVVTCTIVMLQPSLPLFLLAIVFYSISWNILTHAASSYILYSVPESVAGKMFGLYGSLYKLGSFVGTLFIGYILSWSFSKVGLFFLFYTLVTLVLTLFFLKPENRVYDHNFSSAFRSYWKSPSQWKRSFESMREFSPISWVTAMDGFVGYLFSSTIWFVLPLSISKFGRTIFPEGIVLGVFEFTGIIFVIIGGYFADKFSKKKLFLALLLLMTATTFALGFVGHVYIFLLIAFITAAIRDMSNAPLDAMLSEIDKKHDKDGTLLGMIGVFTDMGFIVGPVVSSFFFSWFGLQGVFIFLGFVVLADWVVSALMLKDYKPSRIKAKEVRIHMKSIGHHRRRHC